MIKPRSISRIYEKSFIDKVVSKLKVKFANSDLQIKNFTEQDKSLIINIKDLKNLYNTRIDLACPYKEFLNNSIEYIFEDKLSEDEINKISR